MFCVWHRHKYYGGLPPLVRRVGLLVRLPVGWWLRVGRVGLVSEDRQIFFAFVESGAALHCAIDDLRVSHLESIVAYAA